jgi:multisubunit Na+/H+ antiporter MnhG subunit
MGTRIGVMRQDASGLQETVYKGFNWPCLFFGCFWYFVKGMWGKGILAFLFAILTASLSWLFIMPFLANKQYREHLGSRGYRLIPSDH